MLSKKDRQGLAIIAVSVAVVAALIALVSVRSGQVRAYDHETLCPTDRPVPHTVILVDKTDSFSPSQQAYLRLTIERIRDRMVRFERLSIFVMDKDGVGAPLFSLCNPGTRADANEFYENPEMIQARFRERFGAPLEALLKELLLASTAPRSPIFEAIRDVALQTELARNKEKKHLYVFSDLLQHTQEFSQYKGNSTFEQFHKTRSDYAAMVMAPLNGVEVKVIYLRRPQFAKSQTMAHIHFWETYFHTVGATLVEVEPIP
ncbi:MAG: hypothetical protein ABT940_06745 [Alphaproteobacteria bacterium]